MKGTTKTNMSYRSITWSKLTNKNITKLEKAEKPSNGFLYALGFFCLLNIASSEFEKQSPQDTNVDRIYAEVVLDL